jgi:hypothetical protein
VVVRQLTSSQRSPFDMPRTLGYWIIQSSSPLREDLEVVPCRVQLFVVLLLA